MRKKLLLFGILLSLVFGGVAFAQARSVKLAVVDNLVENGDVTAVACHPNMSKIKISGTGTVGRSIWVVLDSPFSNSNLSMIQCGKTMDTYDPQHPIIGQDLVGTDGKFDCYIDTKDLEQNALKGRKLYIYTRDNSTTYMYKLKGDKQGQPAPNCSIWATNFICNSQDVNNNYNTLNHSLNITCDGKEYYNKSSRTGDMNESIMLPEGGSCEATCHSLDSNFQIYGFNNSNSLGVIPDNQLTKITNEKVIFIMDKYKPVYRWVFKNPNDEPIPGSPIDITCFSDETDRIRLSGTSNIEPGIDELGLNIFYGDSKDQAELLFGFTSYQSTPEQQWHIFDKNFVIDLNKSLLKNQSGKFYVYTGVTSYDQTYQGEVSMQCAKTVKYNQPPDTVKPTFGRGNLCQSSGNGCSCLDNGITTFEGYASFTQDGTELSQGWFEMYASESENYSKSNGNLLFGLLVRRDFTGQINTNLLNLDFSKQNIFFDFPDKGEVQVRKLNKDIFKCAASGDDTCIAENQNIVTGKSCCTGLEVKDGKCVKADTSKVKFKLIGNVRDSESKEKIADVGSNVKMTIECDDGKVRNLSTKDGYFIYNINNLPVSGCKLINNTDALVRNNWSIADYKYKGYTLCKDSEIGKTNASCASNFITKNSWDMSTISNDSKYQIVYYYDKLDVENEPVNSDLEDKIDQLILMIKKILDNLGIEL